MDADRFVAREIQQTALRALPLLVRELTVNQKGIELIASAAAPHGLTENMKFFINGHPSDEVEYPITDSNLLAKFSEVRGGSATVRAHLTSNLASILEAQFFRIDASPVGIFTHSRWRQTVVVGNPARERYSFPAADKIRRVIGDTHQIRFSLGGATMRHHQAETHRWQRMVEQEILEHRAVEGSADERCHHRLSQYRAPLSPTKCAKNSGHFLSS